ncbi:MAG: hypothetical protein DMD81_25455 [Candidatus Rokuibacteriota bacterium]|nr:MAG: hypothetical protein DMD81_25455 [Candidatus Rokubacteria bacterium]
MTHRLDVLFQPGRIGSLTVKNRLVMSSMYTAMCHPDGGVSTELVDYLVERARGEVGLILTEAAAVTDDGRPSVGALNVSDDRFVPALARLADTVKINGAAIGLQLGHCGPQKSSGILPVVAASPVPWKSLVPRELSVEEIRDIVRAFGQGARRAKLAGFDLVELHAAHGYLITSFLSPRTNRRNDGYGGTPANRLRFLIDVLCEVRREVGDGFPVTVKLSAIEYVEDGLTLEESLRIAERLEAEGADAIHVSAGSHDAWDFEVPPHYKPLAMNVPAAAAVKAAIRIPVMVVGSMGEPEVAARAVATGEVDFVVLGRALLADPYWPRKARENRPEDIRPCIRVNDGCFARGISALRPVGCSVNFAAGRESSVASEDLPRAPESKRVAVIGGGPSGLEAARVTALRGHVVTLFEREPELGGQARLASTMPFKQDLLRYVAYLTTQVQKLGVTVRHESATLAVVQALAPHVVILATGGVPYRPTIPGIQATQVVDVLAALRSEPAGRRVAVVGGGQAAVEIAAHLSERGREVTILHAGASVGDDLNPHMQAHMTRILTRVRILTGAVLHSVTDAGVTIVDQSQAHRHVDCDAVILAIRSVPLVELERPLREAGLELRKVGDCRLPRLIMDGVHEAYRTASSI